MCQKINLELLNKNTQPKVKVPIFDIRKQKKKSYKCPKGCGRVFSQKSNLNTHMRVHTGEKPYKCEHPSCGKRFTTLGNLRAHQSLHNGSKKFECDFPLCGKRYFLKYRLNIHARTHLKEKPFRCNECGKSFNEKGNLKIHLRIHTGERPFVCNLCTKAFRTQSHLKDHKKRHQCTTNPNEVESMRISAPLNKTVGSPINNVSVNTNCTVKNNLSTWDPINSDARECSSDNLMLSDPCVNNDQDLYFQDGIFDQFFWNSFQNTFMCPSLKFDGKEDYIYQNNYS